MPIYDYSCPSCGNRREVFSRQLGAEPPSVSCTQCGRDMARAISRVAIRVSRPQKYSEDFRERMLPFLKGRPETSGMFDRGGESEEATAYKLTEAIGEKVDSVLQEKVFKNLPD